MIRALAPAAIVGAVVYPAILGVCSLLTGHGEPLGIILLFVPAGAVAGTWLRLIF